MKAGDYFLLPCSALQSDLTVTEALLLFKINSLSMSGGCTARNPYFAEILNKSERTIQDLIQSLIRKGYLDRELIYKKNSKEIKSRILNSTDKVVRILALGGCENLHLGGAKSCVDNNIDIIDIKETTIIEQRRSTFKNEVNSFKEYDQLLLDDFFDHWSEANKSNTKMKFEIQRTWDTSLRLKKWKRNKDTDFGRKPDAQTEPDYRRFD